MLNIQTIIIIQMVVIFLGVATATYVGKPREREYRRTLESTIPTLKVKGEIQTTEGGIATMYASTETTYTPTWKEPTDFIFLVQALPFNKTAVYVHGADEITIAPSGYITFPNALTAVNYMGITLTITAGTYGGLTGLALFPKDFTYEVRIWALIGGVSTEMIVLMTPLTPRQYINFELFDNSAVTALQIDFVVHEIGVISNMTEALTSKIAILHMLSAIEVKFNSYNVIDKYGSLMNVSTGLLPNDLTGYMTNIMSHPAFASIVSLIPEMDQADIAYRIINALYYADDKNWITITDYMESQRDIGDLLNQVKFYLANLMTGMGNDPMIPSAVKNIAQKALLEKNSQDVITSVAIMAAVDDVIIELSP